MKFNTIVHQNLTHYKLAQSHFYAHMDTSLYAEGYAAL